MSLLILIFGIYSYQSNNRAVETAATTTQSPPAWTDEPACFGSYAARSNLTPAFGFPSPLAERGVLAPSKVLVSMLQVLSQCSIICCFTSPCRRYPLSASGEGWASARGEVFFSPRQSRTSTVSSDPKTQIEGSYIPCTTVGRVR